ncbi:hypothetical protein AB4144_67995, partial [Rhizobiaceae sp. 2RAB30]
GSLAINDCLRERRWTDEEKAAVEIVAIAISDAIERSQSDAHVAEIMRSAMLQAALAVALTLVGRGSLGGVGGGVGGG